MTEMPVILAAQAGGSLRPSGILFYNMFAPKAVQMQGPSAATRARSAGRPSSVTLVAAAFQEAPKDRDRFPAPATRRRISGLGRGAVAAGRRRIHCYHAAEFGRFGCDGSVELLEYAEVGFDVPCRRVKASRTETCNLAPVIDVAGNDRDARTSLAMW